MLSALVVLGSLLVFIRNHGYLQYLELAAYDLLVAAVEPAIDAPTAVSLVLIDETDIQRLGNWPLNDQQLHDALGRILALQPQAVGLDIYRDLPVRPGHEALSELLASDPRIIAIEKFPEAQRPGIPPPPALRDTDRIGFSDLISDRGGIVRRNLMFQSNDERTGYAFSLQLALAYLAAHGVYAEPDQNDPRLLRLGEITFMPLEPDFGGYNEADDGGYQVMLHYRNRPSPFPVYTLHELMQAGFPADALAGRIVIIGVASDSVKDYFTTPYAILDHSEGVVAGSIVHAHAAQQLVDAALLGRAPLRSWTAGLETAWLWGWVALGFGAAGFAVALWRFVVIVLVGAAGAVAVAWSAFNAGWWIPVVPNLLGWLIAAALSTALLAVHRYREQRALMTLFSRHVSPQVADAIWRRRDHVLEDGRVKPRTFEVTTLFTDLQGFTAISERMQPEPFLEWLNSYLSELTDEIMRHGGVLDDFAGDGIKASFGVPFCEPAQTPDQARRAVHCALALGRKVTALNRFWRLHGRDPVAMRVGIHTGQVVVGTVGSAARMKYTTVGRNVNLAARLEGMKATGALDPSDEGRNCRILVSEQTATLITSEFELQDLGSHDLRGITNRVRVFAIIGPKTKEHADAES